MRTSMCVLAICVVSITLTSCSGHDSDYVPYGLEGMNAYVYDENDKEHFAGYAEGGYFDREDVLDQCQRNAQWKAQELHLDDREWSYICCTVTADSSCATKVR
jgi:hypothetical protein